MRSSLVLLSALAAVAFSAVVQQQMHKRSTLRHKLENSKGFKTGRGPQRVDTSEAMVGNAPITDYYDDVYLTNITIGYPAQTFNVQIDTGSSSLWVIDATCKYEACTGVPDVYTRNLFDTTKSKTLKWTGDTFYIYSGFGYYTGKIATDTITLGGLTYDTQGFGVVTDLSIDYAYVPIDGVLGLAWPDNEFPGVNPVMQNLLHDLDEPLFTIWLDRHVAPSEATLGGLITFGATDAVNCDAQVNYVMLSKKSYWQFPVNNFQLPIYATGRTQQAVSDTADSFIGAPRTAFAAIISATGAKYEIDNGLYIVPCNGNFPELVFTIGGNEYQIPSTEYVLDLELGYGNCAVMAYEATSGGGFAPDWVLGDPWIRTFCNVYDIGNARIGFAKAHHTEI